jgi:hypothetical protein
MVDGDDFESGWKQLPQFATGLPNGVPQTLFGPAN